MSNTPKHQQLPCPVITEEDVATGAMVTMEQIVGSMFPPIDATAEEQEAFYARPSVAECMEARRRSRMSSQTLRDIEDRMQILYGPR
jgi:hypothetical protein